MTAIKRLAVKILINDRLTSIKLISTIFFLRKIKSKKNWNMAERERARGSPITAIS